MAVSKLLLFSIFLTLLLTKITADSETTRDSDAAYHVEPSDSSLIRIELDQLKSKISILESSIDERTHDLERKDESIKKLEKIIQGKSTSVASLQNELQSLKEKGSFNAKEHVGKAHARAGELEKQVDNLKKEIETQEKRKDTLEARANAAEKKIQELNLKLENLQRINNEQKTRIRKTERALQVAEEEMLKAKLMASSISKELIEVREAWLPPWLAVHLVHCQSFVVTQWEQNGKPALDVTVQKALEKKARVEKWVEPHIDTFKTKWIPIIKEHWVSFVTDIEPHMQSLNAKTINVYHASKNSLEPYVLKVQKETKKFTKPYVDQASTMIKPHVDKARVFLKPYTKKVIRRYKKLTKTATSYHRQVQATIREMLRNHEVTKPLATSELVWFTASALMTLPVIFLYNMAAAIFRKKPKKRTRSSHTSHTRRRVKLVHPDK